MSLITDIIQASKAAIAKLQKDKADATNLAASAPSADDVEAANAHIAEMHTIAGTTPPAPHKPVTFSVPQAK